ncbi:hypothetical protein PTTG_27972 [Puccinia triticina 1-1 BBBD Race 1]|uniref:DUF659 domain-containing protein n=1 Tax=Puccinia triticina (isolate 1-1 / race 1 (BBBD)) TaxID=630390 RepID=A0A180GHE2_PUCT1|nr:hypothetical protein PTTG_27972 [Puccinia triticina 1-1 BBBD Race 1]
MAPTRKKHKNQSSRASSTHDNPTDNQTDEGNPSQASTKDNNTDARASTQPPSGASHIITNEEELRQAKKIALNSISSSYGQYEMPELSNQLDKHGRRMIAYPCKLCGTKINCPTSDSSCSNLKKHASICLHKHQEIKSTHSLAGLGIKGTGEIIPKEVPQLCAIWCAKAARPFLALVDASHKAILHPTVIKHLPRPHDVSRDIHLLYLAIQQNYCNSLNAHKGALYLGVDAWQSPNGFDILGTVIYRLVEGSNSDMKLEAMPLDFLWLSCSHTGEYLAKTVALVVEKFGIKDKICGLVSNNAKNNKVMVRELKKLQWPRFRGEADWIRCFAHILNLIVQAILRPFGNKKQKIQGQLMQMSTPMGHKVERMTLQIKSKCKKDDSTLIQDEDTEAEEESLCASDDDDSLSEGDIERASEEDDDDNYTTDSCKITLAKFRAITKKLRFSPNSKAKFVEICEDKECETPHSVERDVRTRWNSTFSQLQSILWCEPEILEWQRLKQHGVEHKYYLDRADLDLARDLVHVLGIFQELTLKVSTAGMSRLSNIVVYIDQITEHLSTVISNIKYPPALRNACQHGLKLTNKYYSLTDSSPLYRISILLHPSFKDKYFKLAKWEPGWIAEAIRLARDMWSLFYKPQLPTPPLTAPTPASKPMTSMLAGLSNAAAARGGNCSNNALDVWLSGGLVLNGNEPVNPLKW